MNHFHLTDTCKHFNPTFNEEKPCLTYIPNGQSCGFCGRPNRYRCIADTLNIPLSHSSVQNYITCHRLYFLKDIMGIRMKDPFVSPAIKMGSLWDACMQKSSGQTVDIPKLIERYEMADRDVEKVKAVYKAYRTLEIRSEESPDIQSEISLCINLPDNPLYIRGFFDRRYPTYYEEDKFTSRPDNYLDPYFISSQNSTYFLADESLEYCVMKPVRVPDLKSTKSHDGESDEEYGERVYQDILKRPSFYFVGYNKAKKTFGKKYYRSEFDLEAVKNRYIHITREINLAKTTMNEGGDAFYANDKVCNSVLPGIPCGLKSICKTGCLDTNQFEIRKDKGGEI